MKDEMVYLEPFDWRYSAAIVGLRKYLEWLGVEEPGLIVTEEYVKYNRKYFKKSDFLKFVEIYFKDEMYHIKMEEILKEKNPSEKQIDYINKKIKNRDLKDIFHKIKYDGKNQTEIQNIIDKNREEIVNKIFQNNIYIKYCNEYQLLKEGQKCCRLKGYYIDMAKKGKSISYGFDKSNYVGNDITEFDFIPFAFSGWREKFFINDNIDLKRLQRMNYQWEHIVRSQKKEPKMDTQKVFIDSLIRSYDFLECDVEVIMKRPEHEYFETLYLRKESLKILKSMKSYYKVFVNIKIRENYWINTLKKVFDSVVNLTLLDDLINELLKNLNSKNEEYLHIIISNLLKVNIEIKKGEKQMEEMKKTMNIAYICAKQVVEKKDKNKFRVSDTKLKSYCTKLTNAIILDDYDQFQKILINLSNYAEIPFGFAYDLFEDFEKNKEVAYTFVNTLNRYKKDDQEEK